MMSISLVAIASVPIFSPLCLSRSKYRLRIPSSFKELKGLAIAIEADCISPTARQNNVGFLTLMQNPITSRSRGRDSSTVKPRRKNLQRTLAGGNIGGSVEELDMKEVSSLEPVRNKSSSSKLLTLPTILTLARVMAVPTLVAVFYSTERWANTLGVAIFVMASLTDWLDGYLARKMESSSEFGAFLDPVADKLMVATTLVLLCASPPPILGFSAAPWLVSLPAIAIIGREITMSAVREWAAAQGGELLKVVAVNKLGKAKTASQMVALTLLLASRAVGINVGVWTQILGVCVLNVSALLALWSLGVYVKGLWGSMFR